MLHLERNSGFLVLLKLLLSVFIAGVVGLAEANADTQAAVMDFSGVSGDKYCQAIQAPGSRAVYPFRYYPTTKYYGNNICGADEYYQYDYSVILKFNINQFDGYYFHMPSPTYRCQAPYVRDPAKAVTAPDACVRNPGPYSPKDQDTPPCDKRTTKPVNIATGNEHFNSEDFHSGGAGGLLFVRTYDSGSPLADAGLGARWTYSFSRHLNLTNLSSAAYFVSAIRDEGKEIEFAGDSTGSFSAIDDDINWTLTRLQDSAWNTTEWQLLDKHEGTLERYDPSGRLLQVILRNGRSYTLGYDSGNNLATIADSFGVTISFTWSSGRISSISTPLGVISYGYDGIGNLSSVTYPDQSTLSYLYEDSRFSNALTGIVDAKGSRWATISYGTDGRVSQTQLNGGVQLTNITYNSDGSVSVADGGGFAWTTTFDLKQGVQLVSGRNHPAASGCSASAEAKSYDVNGNISSRTNFSGVVTTYTYDLTRNLETSRTEASGTPRARTITTTWHSTYGLPLSVTEPGRVTTYTYDNHGNRLTKTITDTATNQNQTWTWTYNALGQVLTEDGPRTDVSDVTTYAYYDSSSSYYGDLQSITNAVGQMTQFTSYNSNGQVLTQVDPNGVATSFAYDARGHLTSRTTNGKSTAYAYDAVGQMTKVTLPDGSWVSYVYDDAHRLTQIQDQAGNKIVYTLDAMSRRTKEEIQDTGTLAALLDWIKHSMASQTAP